MSSRTLLPGHVAYEEIIPRWPKDENFAKINGKTSLILQPEAAKTGRFSCEECRYGRVIQTGIPVERSTCKPLEGVDAEVFRMIEPGAYICIRTTQNWKTGPNEFVCNSFDIISVDPKPVWAPQE